MPNLRISQIQERLFPPPHPRGIPRAFDERLAPFGGEFDVKRSLPGRAFDYRENVDQRQQAKGLHGKG